MSKLFAFNASSQTSGITSEGCYDAEQQLWVGEKTTVAAICISCPYTDWSVKMDCTSELRECEHARGLVNSGLAGQCVCPNHEGGLCGWNVFRFSYCFRYR